jgi:hypothetical protein
MDRKHELMTNKSRMMIRHVVNAPLLFFVKLGKELPGALLPGGRVTGLLSRTPGLSPSKLLLAPGCQGLDVFRFLGFAFDRAYALFDAPLTRFALCLVLVEVVAVRSSKLSCMDAQGIEMHVSGCNTEGFTGDGIIRTPARIRLRDSQRD